MFDFLLMSDNYDDRKVDRFEKGSLVISTASVTDSSQPFETGISHPAYNNGNFIIVEQYNDLEEAISGHKKWVTKMKTLPPRLTDISTSEISQWRNSLPGETKNVHEKS